MHAGPPEDNPVADNETVGVVFSPDGRGCTSAPSAASPSGGQLPRGVVYEITGPFRAAPRVERPVPGGGRPGAARARVGVGGAGGARGRDASGSAAAAERRRRTTGRGSVGGDGTDRVAPGVTLGLRRRIARGALPALRPAADRRPRRARGRPRPPRRPLARALGPDRTGRADRRGSRPRRAAPRAGGSRAPPPAPHDDGAPDRRRRRRPRQPHGGAAQRDHRRVAAGPLPSCGGMRAALAALAHADRRRARGGRAARRRGHDPPRRRGHAAHPRDDLGGPRLRLRPRARRGQPLRPRRHVRHGPRRALALLRRRRHVRDRATPTRRPNNLASDFFWAKVDQGPGRSSGCWRRAADGPGRRGAARSCAATPRATTTSSREKAAQNRTRAAPASRGSSRSRRSTSTGASTSSRCWPRRWSRSTGSAARSRRRRRCPPTRAPPSARWRPRDDLRRLDRPFGVGSNADRARPRRDRQPPRDAARQPAPAVVRRRALLSRSHLDDPRRARRRRRVALRRAGRQHRLHEGPRVEPHGLDRAALRRSSSCSSCPGSPTTYLVDGQPKEMKRTTVTVAARQGRARRHAHALLDRPRARSRPRCRGCRSSRGRRRARSSCSTPTPRTSAACSTTSSRSTGRGSVAELRRHPQAPPRDPVGEHDRRRPRGQRVLRRHRLDPGRLGRQARRLLDAARHRARPARARAGARRDALGLRARRGRSCPSTSCPSCCATTTRRTRTTRTGSRTRARGSRASRGSSARSAPIRSPRTRMAFTHHRGRAADGGRVHACAGCGRDVQQPRQARRSCGATSWSSCAAPSRACPPRRATCSRRWSGRDDARRPRRRAVPPLRRARDRRRRVAVPHAVRPRRPGRHAERARHGRTPRSAGAARRDRRPAARRRRRSTRRCRRVPVRDARRAHPAARRPRPARALQRASTRAFDPQKGYTDVNYGATYIQAVQFTDDRACPIEAPHRARATRCRPTRRRRTSPTGRSSSSTSSGSTSRSARTTSRSARRWWSGSERAAPRAAARRREADQRRALPPRAPALPPRAARARDDHPAAGRPRRAAHHAHAEPRPPRGAGCACAAAAPSASCSSRAPATSACAPRDHPRPAPRTGRVLPCPVAPSPSARSPPSPRAAARGRREHAATRRSCPPAAACSSRCAPAPGEPYVVRRAPRAPARPARVGQRRSLLYFGQLTDPQLLDEVSPIRVDFLDQAGGAGQGRVAARWTSCRRRSSTRSSAR